LPLLRFLFQTADFSKGRNYMRRAAGQTTSKTCFTTYKFHFLLRLAISADSAEAIKAV
jgi:hypothetical protein